MTDAELPVWERLRASSRAQRFRAYLWPFYSISFALPAIAAMYGLIRDRRQEWLYHPFLSAAFGFEFWRQAAIVALDRLKHNAN
jgi:hypothetical protein